MTTEVQSSEETQTVSTTTIDASELARALGNAALFASKDRARPILTNVRLDVDADSLTLEATDSYALIKETVAVVGGQPSTMFIDSQDATKVAKAAKAQKRGTVEMWTVANVVTFKGEGWSFELDSPIEADQWPKTSSLWPSDFAGVDADGVGFGLMQMARLSKVVLPNGWKATDTSAALSIKYNGSLKPFTASYATLTILVMPCRLG